ncbi:MAG: permease [Candidatus Tectomicrobia bacterium]|uniref:Permease n=1 Tax=Tectimicrobiota bacterium TaxID=2528274 RepID=A0A932MLG0_UNCTE|nr:permease [Candidatus Tectomicrobia bacterium]
MQYAPAASRWTRIGAAPGRPRAWLALALLAGAGLFGLGLGMGLTPGRMAGEALRNLLFAADAFWKILPYFAASVLISAWATTSGLAERVQILFRRGEVPAILGAAAVGAVVPLCSCGVIPAIAALLAGGVPLGPVMAFWISAPVMSPEKFTLMAGVLGLPYALMNLASAVAIGAGAGLAARFAVRRGLLAGQIKPLGGAGACCGAASPSPPDQGAASAGAYRNTPLQGGPGGMAPALSPFVRQAAASALFLGKWLALAFLLEALTTHYVDPAWIQALLGGSSPWSIPLATAVGIPLYVSGVAAIPIVGGLLEGGMSPGAAMAFLVAGPVTTVCAVGAVLALVRGRAFALYLGSGILGSLAAGYAFQWMMG